MSKSVAPILIMGMHRSGTSLLVKILERLGFFAGKRKDSNNEAVFFLNLNCWLLNKCGGEWDNPESISWLIDNYKIEPVMIDYLKHYLDTPRQINYLGLNKYLRYKSLFNLDIPWGWKDPRNTFTLPLWNKIFPDLKFIHIYRHGVDVAHSLQDRAEKHLQSSVSSYHQKKKLYIFTTKRGGFTHSYRCLDLNGGLSLWEVYLKEARKHVSEYGPRAIEVKFEDLLLDTSTILDKILAFCNIQVDDEKVKKATETLKTDRAFAYKKVSELRTFSRRMESTLAKYGYCR